MTLEDAINSNWTTYIYTVTKETMLFKPKGLDKVISIGTYTIYTYICMYLATLKEGVVVIFPEVTVNSRY